MGHVSNELAKSGISVADEVAKEFLLKIAGPGAEEIGLIFQDKLRLSRFKNQLRILVKAKEMLNNSGLTPNEVPLRTLIPILEAASYEDDEYLSKKWAALLANSAAKNDGAASHPSFPRILSEIAPVEARFLDYLLLSGGETDWNSFRDDLTMKLQVTHDDINSYYGNLFRLGLVTISAKGIPTGTNKGVMTLSTYGKVFLTACTPPESRDI